MVVVVVVAAVGMMMVVTVMATIVVTVMPVVVVVVVVASLHIITQQVLVEIQRLTFAIIDHQFILAQLVAGLVVRVLVCSLEPVAAPLLRVSLVVFRLTRQVEAAVDERDRLGLSDFRRAAAVVAIDLNAGSSL